MTRIAFVLPSMAGGGAERVALTLIEEFLERGHEIDLVLMRDEGELMPLVPPQVTIVDLKARRIRHSLRPLIRYLRQRRPAAIQASMWPLTVVAILARGLSGIKARLVVSDHTTISEHYAHFGPLRRAMLRKSIRLTYPRADARIVVSNRSADDLASLANIDRGGIAVIHNPISRPPDTSRDVAQEWGGAGARILAVGQLKPEKNHRLLLEAFARLAQTKVARLMIVGDGGLKSDLAAQAAALGIADRVVFAGFQLDPWPYYRAADLFVLSSNYEGLGNVLVEAMRMGLPVVSTDCPHGPREILDNGRFGRLTPVGDPDALAEAMAATLGKRPDPDLLKTRAEALAGGAVHRYEMTMMGELQS